MAESAGPAHPARRNWFQNAVAVLGHRKTATMFGFGFSSGLPYALLVGTMNAWFGEANVDLATIGVLSWIGLAYAFKFLWSPAVNAPAPFPFGQLGRRRGWIFLCQCVIAVSIFVISTLDPQTGLGLMALAAAVAAFASATQDMSIDAWRIEVADTAAPIDLLSAVYQFGYRIAAFVGGAGALFLADLTNWNVTFATASVVMAMAFVAALAAPEPERAPVAAKDVKAVTPEDASLRFVSVTAVIGAWGWAAFELTWMMVASVTTTPPPDVKAFTGTYGPLIVVATVIFPCVLAAWIANRERWPIPLPQLSVPTGALAMTNRLYGAIVEPFVELMSRLKWTAVLFLILVLSYRLTDAIWGPFAYPFYMGELGYSKSEVAFASKTFGVFVLIVGILLSAWSLLRLGRMISLMIGAVSAAATNLLYADLANGSPYIDAFLHGTGISWLAKVTGAGLYDFLQTVGLGAISTTVALDDRMLRLLVAIAGENIAAGYAGAVFVAYMSSMASRLHGAVQFAVFSSLTMLIGTLGRGALGDMIKTDGYASVFFFTMWLGGIAVVACAIEWIRQARSGGSR